MSLYEPPNKWLERTMLADTSLAGRRASAAPHRPPFSRTVGQNELMPGEGTMTLTAWLRRMAVVIFGASILLSGCTLGHRTSWRPLFNGHDLTGWEHVGPGGFAVQDGVLKTEGGMGLLWYTGQMFGDVAIRVVYRNPGGANSGVFIRIPEKPTEPWMPVNRGYEVQIDDHGDDYHVTGVLYSLTPVAVRPARADEWNTMEIALDRDRTTVTINGVQVTDYREGQPVPPKKEEWEPDRGPRPRSGYIGLQNHSDEDIVYFREVSVRSLH